MISSTHFHFNPPGSWMQINTIDMHAGGEPLRIITGGLPHIPGNTILEKRRYFQENLDHIRKGLIWEPRGHADMYGAVITEPCSSDADFGTFFLHNEGYSTMCGHAIIALTKFALETEFIKKKVDDKNLIIEVPSGKIYAEGKMNNGIVELSIFKNVPSFVLMQNKEIDILGIGHVVFDVAFGGAFYALVKAKDFSVSMIPENYDKFIDIGRQVKQAIKAKYEIKHPFEEDLSFLYGTIFSGPPVSTEHHSRNVCIFANGELDRSATGSGISARAALHHALGEINTGDVLTIESILGTTMQVKVIEEVKFGSYNAVIPEVSGTSHFTGNHTFYFDPEDPLKNGFILR